ncbi:MAG: phenylalanine--tRNA ligase subunit alpha [Anaerolineae bacterium]|nr:phenylalanine--tRNA ligase subunit alpha [Phycisphaerae bacterium]
MSNATEQADQIRSLATAAVTAVEQANSPAALEELRIKYMARNGEITLLSRGIGKAAPEDRAAIGAAVNEANKSVQAAFDAKKESLGGSAGAAKKSASAIDVTLPGIRRPVGRRHPLSAVDEEIKAIFIGMGFQYDDYPEVETEFNNFDSLNMPTWHPAREMQDSFFTETGHVLRTHTTSFQMHAMQKLKPPLRSFTLGRCYRRDEIDATHYPMFHQVDAIAIDRGISFVDLKWTLFQWLRTQLGPDIKLRMRPSYFPFTTPSAEVDVFFRGRWMELGGSGMIHPDVMRHANLDPNEWQGFAFGMGTERICLARHNIDDIRLLYENDESFLRQF